MAALSNTAAPHSPSPPPSAPIPTTPGALATRLSETYRAALKHTLQACSYENFAACFPTPAARTPRVLRAVWEQLAGKIESKALDEFEGILAERDAVHALNALEGLLVEARGRRREGGEGESGVPPHALPPQDLYQAHLAPMLEPIQSELESQLQATRAHNEELAEDVRRQRQEIEAIVGGLEAAVRDLEGTNEVLGAVVEGENVRAEVAGMHGELKEVAAKL